MPPQTAERHARRLAHLAIQRLVGSSSRRGAAAARLYFALAWGVGDAAAPRDGDVEVGGLLPWAGGPLPLGRTSSQFSRASYAEDCGAGVRPAGGAEDGAAAPEARWLAYEMYVGFSAGRAENVGLPSGRGARLAALSESSSSSLWYTRRVVCLSVRLSVCLSVCLSVFLSVLLSCYLSIYHCL
jgi:hypothetical protein